MTNLYEPAHEAPATPQEPALWFAFRNGELLVCESDTLPSCIRLADHGIEHEHAHYLGRYDGQHCYAVTLDASVVLPNGWRPVGLRDAFGFLEVELAALSGRAFQILEWDRNNRFCGRCGTRTVQGRTERSRRCPECRLTTYPPVTPAVMVLVTDGGRRVLLARKPNAPQGRYSAVAGFVEPGEMLEDTVARETREEVGVEVKNIRYFGSQPWPFPHSLMIAFTAEYAGGEVRPDGVEIEDARWFDAAELPTVPGSISISRRLIDTVCRTLIAAHFAEPKSP